MKYEIYNTRTNIESSPRPQKIRAIIINIIRKTIRILKLRSRSISMLDNLCTVMEERLIKNTYNKQFDTGRKRWIMD